MAQPRISVQPDGSSVHVTWVSTSKQDLYHYWRDSSGTWHGEKFLTPFLKMVEQGEMPTIFELKRAYENLVGKKVRKVVIFRLLDRHQWEQGIIGFDIGNKYLEEKE